MLLHFTYLCTDIINIILLLYAGGLPCENFAVGISNRTRVKDDQFDATSFLGRDHRPFNARLKSPRDRGWCSTVSGRQNSYLEINLERDLAFCGIRIQGAARGHVNSFQLRFARDKRGPFVPFGTVRNNPSVEVLFCNSSIGQVFLLEIDQKNVEAECKG